MADITALLSSKNNEWYTPEKFIEAAREVMGGIDLDPASCAHANEMVKAARYYTKEDNGLMHSWPGRVWCNPPYGLTNGKSNQAIWSRRLISQYEQGITSEAILLVNASTSESWFQRLLNGYLVCFLRGRINFSTPDGSQSGPTHGSAFFYFGKQRNRFRDVFNPFGAVMVSCYPSRKLYAINFELFGEE